MSRLVKKYCFCQNLLKNLFVLQKKLSFLKFLGQYLIVPLLVCFQLNYSFFSCLWSIQVVLILFFFLNDTIDVHENICAKKFCSQKRCPSLAKGMEMVLGLGGHSAFQEATEIISRGSWRLSPPPTSLEGAAFKSLHLWSGVSDSQRVNIVRRKRYRIFVQRVNIVEEGDTEYLYNWVDIVEEGDTGYLYKGLIL